MKQMNDKVFLDTNIVVYSYSNSEIGKQVIARTLITERNSFISTQVLQEFANIITRKFAVSYTATQIAIAECCRNNNLHTSTVTTITQACHIAERYGFSFYDSLIISSALESECSILFSEDMHNGQIIEEQLTIVNPFVKE